jgi:plastocyanin
MLGDVLWPCTPLAFRRPLLAVLGAVVVLGLAVTPAMALPGSKISTAQYAPAANYPGIQHLHYEYGPIPIEPGQNTIDARPTSDLKPQVPGFITRFKPNLIYAQSRKVPRVDVIHLHHGVWLINGYPTMAAGEEKTSTILPQGYGFHSDPDDSWILNYMIHNLTADPTSVKLTYDIDFVPDTEPAAAGIVKAHPLWMDVAGLKTYPVFDAIKGHGRNGRFTFPDMAYGSARDNIGFAQKHTASENMTLLGTAGHLHPGGLYNDLDVTRGGQRKLVFRSQAKYFEPAGAVSWDVSMTATRPGWRVAVQKGDTLSTSVTYDTSRASWYESMGIMVVWYANGIRAGAVDPFAGQVDTTGLLTHGHLPENDNHGGDPFPLPDATKLHDGFITSSVAIRDFLYGRGDLNGVGKSGRPPVVKKGRSITFTNFDGSSDIPYWKQAYHTITACRRPCNRSTGVAYPVADGNAKFDSKELGYGPSGFTPAANTNQWSTPKNLAPGTYTYFCRIHPFMRGAFRVKR